MSANESPQLSDFKASSLSLLSPFFFGQVPSCAFTSSCKVMGKRWSVAKLLLTLRTPRMAKSIRADYGYYYCSHSVGTNWKIISVSSRNTEIGGHSSPPNNHIHLAVSSWWLSDWWFALGLTEYRSTNHDYYHNILSTPLDWSKL